MTGQSAAVLPIEWEADMPDRKVDDRTTRSALAEAAETLARLLGSGEPLSVEEAGEALNALKLFAEAIHPGLVNDAQAFADQWSSQRHLYPGLPDSLPLEESVYKPWTADPSHPLAGRKGLAWGDPAAHMEEVLKGFDIMPNPEDPRSPDHVAVLLEFLAFLLENRPISEAASFCADHLDWLPELRAEADRRGIQGLFQTLVLSAEGLKDLISTQITGDYHGR